MLVCRRVPLRTVAQLAEWGRRVVFRLPTGLEKSVYLLASSLMEMERAIAENIDVLMIDTAGRLQNRTTSWQGA